MRLLPRNGAANGSVDKSAPRGEVVRRYEITVEREFVAVQTESGGNVTAFCGECGRDVPMLLPETAAVAAGTTTRNIYRWIEGGRLHFVEPTSGQLFVCAESLQQLARFALDSPADGDPERRKENPR